MIYAWYGRGIVWIYDLSTNTASRIERDGANTLSGWAETHWLLTSEDIEYATELHMNEWERIA